MYININSVYKCVCICVCDYNRERQVTSKENGN